MPQPRAERVQLSALTSLRFFAAFYVVLYHAYSWPRSGSAAFEAASLPWRTFYRFCSHGFTAVGFFFTLSGFILAYNYPGARGVAAARFYRARFARVYPVYFVGLMAALPFLAARTWREHAWSHAALECALATFLVQAWFPTYWNAVNIPGWSLSVEAFFYSLYPRLVTVLARVSRSVVGALGTLALLWALALVVPALGTWTYGVQPFDTSVLANFIRYSPPLALPEFAFGVVLGHMRLYGLADARWVAHAYLPALALLGLALATDAVPYLLLHNGVLLPLIGIVILHHSRAGGQRRWLSHPGWVALGEASYALYVLHLLVWIYMKIALERSGFDPLAEWVFPVYALIAIATSRLAFRWIEQPARRRLYPAR